MSILIGAERMNDGFTKPVKPMENGCFHGSLLPAYLFSVETLTGENNRCFDRFSLAG